MTKESKPQSSVQIIYEDPVERPIKQVTWTYAGAPYLVMLGPETGTLYVDDIEVSADDALDWARAVLKMVGQRHG